MVENGDKSIVLSRKICDITDELRDFWLQKQSCSCARDITGLTVNQGRLFRAVWRMTESVPQGIMLRDLADKLGLSCSTVSVMVESMVQRGYLERSVDGDDRRKVMIRLSEKGNRYLADTENFFGDKIGQFIQEYDPKKIRCFEKVIDDLSQYLSEIKQGGCKK